MPTPSEQLLTRTVYATDGVTTNWDFSFSGGYLDKSHVKAFTEATTGERTEIIVTEAMIVGPFQVRIAPALAAGLTLTVYRDTPKDLPLVDFTDESGFSEIALDTNAKQAVFIAAETTDTVNTSSSYDAEQAASQAATAAGEAQASATAAAASALLAANEADASEVSATASAASAVNSANSAASSSAAATAVFNANTTTYTRTLLDDTTASAARATLGAATAGPLAGSGITGAAASGANTDIISLANIASINDGQLAGMRNRIINGSVQVVQRGLTFTPATGAVYGADRWYMYSNGAAPASHTIQSSGGPSLENPSYLSGVGAAGITSCGWGQRIESVNCLGLAGQTVTLSAWVFTGDTRPVSLVLAYPNAKDTYGATTLIASTATASASGWRKVSASFSVPLAAVTGLVCEASFGAVGAGVFIALTGVQLEVGSIATPFEHRPYGMELALCQRYYESITGDRYVVGTTYSQTAGPTITSEPFLVEKRAVPTITLSTARWYNGAFLNGTSANNAVASTRCVAYNVNIGTSSLTYQAVIAFAQTLTANAEL